MARSNGLKVKVQTTMPGFRPTQREFAAANGSLAMAESCIKMSANCKDKQPNFCECHLRIDAEAAEVCMRNIARLVKPGGYLFVSGVDLEVRTRVARSLGWKPVGDLLRETHEGDVP